MIIIHLPEPIDDVELFSFGEYTAFLELKFLGVKLSLEGMLGWAYNVLPHRLRLLISFNLIDISSCCQAKYSSKTSTNSILNYLLNRFVNNCNTCNKAALVCANLKRDLSENVKELVA